MTDLAIILDTECTGLKDPEPLEVAYSDPFAFPTEATPQTIDGNIERFKPRKPIEYGAMAAHMIIPGMYDIYPEWPGSWTLPAGTNYLIGHNIDYDWEAIGKPDLKRICTLHLTRKQWPQLDSHQLSALRFFRITLHPEWGPEKWIECRDRLIEGAHTAEGDTLSCWLILHEILKLHPEITSWEQLYQLSEWSRIPEYMTFGKYGPDSDWAREYDMPKGMLCRDVYSYDRGYYRWLFRDCKRVLENPYLQKALRSGE